MPENNHIPVLLDTIVTTLDLGQQIRWKIFDGTLGGGGYTSKFLELGFEVFACDLDESAISITKKNFKSKTDLHLENKNFADYIGDFDDKFFDLITLDLGYSSNQLSNSQKGFSYQKEDEVLDIRYDNNTGLPVWKMIQSLKAVDNLWKVIYTYSGEKYARPIARNLFALAQSKKVNGSEILVGQAVDTIVQAIPARDKKNKNAILSRVWQALRIWTNDEFTSLEKFLPVAIHKLKVNGVLAIVCFHSLEDKIVTKFMRHSAASYELDDKGAKAQDFEVLTKKPILPTHEEIEANVRSRSAILRILKRIN
jgi:16S rRNA (cytosine1402-N4)-methyltransferase